MSKASIINDEFIRNAAPNSAAVENAKKISQKGGFVKLCISEDETLLFGECKGSGKNPYITSADLIGETPVFRCNCPSRQFPCKHALALMMDYAAGKTFETAPVPDDIKSKREKLAQKAEKAANTAEHPAPKQNTAAAAKKLQKQREGLELAERFVNEILSHGAAAVSKASAEQYTELAKQLGDYYLPEPQQLIYEIIAAAEAYTSSENPDESVLHTLTHKCVRLAASVKKCREYIDRKLGSGDVLPEDSVLYEAMGGVWKLTQLKELGLFREHAVLLQLSFHVIDDTVRKVLTDTAFWADLSCGEIVMTENIRPYKALKHIKETDSAFGLYQIGTLYLYPGGLNRRVRWENETITKPAADTFRAVIEHAESSAAEAVKKAKNELKNTLSAPYVMLLIPFDRIELSVGKEPVLIHGEEHVLLSENACCPGSVNTLKLIAGELANGAMLCALSYDSSRRMIQVSPVSAVTENGIARL